MADAETTQELYTVIGMHELLTYPIIISGINISPFINKVFHLV